MVEGALEPTPTGRHVVVFNLIRKNILPNDRFFRDDVISCPPQNPGRKSFFGIKQTQRKMHTTAALVGGLELSLLHYFRTERLD